MAAAAALCTTSTSENPPAWTEVAVSTRSTPGSTSWKVAVSPSTSGGGSGSGQDSDREVPAALIVASGPDPPPENVTASPGTAAGLSEPSALRSSVVDTGTQPSPRGTRTGKT